MVNACGFGIPFFWNGLPIRVVLRLFDLLVGP